MCKLKKHKPTNLSSLNSSRFSKSESDKNEFIKAAIQWYELKKQNEKDRR